MILPIAAFNTDLPPASLICPESSNIDVGTALHLYPNFCNLLETQLTLILLLYQKAISRHV